MEILVQEDALASLMTEDPFCACEGVKTLESKLHHERLAQIEQDLRLHLQERDLPCVLTSDLLIRNVPLQKGLAPDIALWPGRQALAPKVDYKSAALSAALCPVLVLEVVSESTVEADREIKYEIYRLARISEYWLYDPMGYVGGPPFQGWRLTGTDYEPIAGGIGTVAGAEVVLYPSVVLDTAWGLEHGTELRLWDPVREDWYRMTPKALLLERTRADQAEARADQAEARADQAEVLIRQERTRAQQREARLQQEIQRLRAQSEAHADRD